MTGELARVCVLCVRCVQVGRRDTGMEDRHVVLANFYSLMKINTMGKDALFCGVYDGHAGALAAEYCRLQLVRTSMTCLLSA